jgi:hypothetical protein
MNVQIGNNTFVFTPDTSGWRISAGELFTTQPVLIGGRSCFIKRYGAAARFTGKDFLLKIKGLSLPGLPQIYDVQSTIETEGQVWYIFQEWLEGNILENKIKTTRTGFFVNPRNLVSNLLNALQSIHKYEYWFADFCNKNIFVTNEGQYMLIDLDSCKPFDNRVTISDILTGFVQNYIVQVLKYAEIRIKDIEAIDINLLQLVMLLCKMKYFAENPDKQYREDELEIIHEPVFQSQKEYTDMIFMYALRNPNPVRPSFVTTLMHQLFKEADKVYALHWLAPLPVIRVTLKQLPQNAVVKYGEEVFLEWSIDHYTSAVLTHGATVENIEKTGKKSLKLTESGQFVIVAKHKQWQQQTQQSYKLEYSVRLPLPVIHSFLATPTRIVDDSEITLRWLTFDTESVKIEAKVGDTVLESLTGQRSGTATLKLNQTCELTLTAIKTFQEKTFTTQKKIPIEVVPPIVDDFSMNVERVFDEGEVILKWRTSNAQSVKIEAKSGDTVWKSWNGDANGAFSLKVNQASVFTLTAIRNLHGRMLSVQKTLPIEVVALKPVVKKWAIQSAYPHGKTIHQIAEDDTYYLVWEIANADKVWIDKGVERAHAYKTGKAEGTSKKFELIASKTLYGETATVTQTLNLAITPLKIPTIPTFRVKNSKGLILDKQMTVQMKERLAIEWEVQDAKEVTLWLRTDSNQLQQIPILQTASNKTTLLLDKQHVGKTHELFLTAKNSRHQFNSDLVPIQVESESQWLKYTLIGIGLLLALLVLSTIANS